MTKVYQRYAEMFDAREPRERGLIAVTLVAVLAFAWWWMTGQPLLAEIKALQQQNATIEAEARALNLSAKQIEQRIQQGVHKSKQDRVEQLTRELRHVERILQEKTVDLIEPDDMFMLMQELITRESKLTLTRLQRSEMTTVFKQQENAEQPHIWYEACKSCDGVFLDAGEFADLKEHTLLDRLKDLFAPERH